MISFHTLLRKLMSLRQNNILAYQNRRGGKVMPDIVSLDDYRPHDAAYVACMKCAHDWVAVFPPPAVPLECPSCAAMAGEPVDHQNVEWFKRFMAGKDREKRTLILLNAARMALR
jgi:anthranilate phosphoribosyltransferase